MGKDSAIEWTTHTQNFWVGCKKVSTGCHSCYMFREQERYGNNPTEIRRTRAGTFYAPMTWKEPAYVFTCSWSDFFLEEADGWRDDAWGIIRQTPHLTYQILTKRPENIPERLPDDWNKGYPNVWLGVSVENQPAFDERVPLLLQVYATNHFVSCEPLLGPIQIGASCPIEWIAVGGESDYKQPRHMKLSWVRAIIEDCQKSQVACFVKQLGTAWARRNDAKDWKGANPDEWPKDLRVREMPNAQTNQGSPI